MVARVSLGSTLVAADMIRAIGPLLFSFTVPQIPDFDETQCRDCHKKAPADHFHDLSAPKFRQGIGLPEFNLLRIRARSTSVGQDQYFVDQLKQVL